MALNNERYSLVGTPRVYCDLTSYLLAIGKKMIRNSAWADDSRQWSSQIGNIGWDMNPIRQRQEEIAYQGTNSVTGQGVLTERISFMEEYGSETTDGGGESQIGTPLDISLRKVINNANYFGVLGHNLNTLSYNQDNPIRCGSYPYSWTEGDNQQSTLFNPSLTEVIGLQDGTDVLHHGDGTFLAKIDEPINNHGNEFSHGIRIDMHTQSQVDNVGKTLELGAMTFGYFYDFPHSPNISVSISYEFDGISRTKTMSGKELVHIDYLRSNWGRFAPFTATRLENDQDFRDVSLQGRRVIDMSFDYINESDMFPKNTHQNVFGQDTYTTGGATNNLGLYQHYDFDQHSHNANILGNYLNLTLGGNLTHILQLDSRANDFLLVKLDGSATQITQKAPKLYSCRLRFVEQF